jgi:hypothetical protein
MTPTMGDQVVGLGCRLAYNLMDDTNLKLYVNLNAWLITVISGSFAMAAANLPQQSVIEKALDSPLAKFVSNMEKPTQIAVLNFVDNKWVQLYEALDARAKATGA